MPVLRSGGARLVALVAALFLSFPAFSSTLPTSSSTTPHPQPVPRPTSLEYQLSWGVGASRAQDAYRAGATGEGIIVAMIDTGLSPSSAPLFSNLSRDSIDLVPDRRADIGDRRHGERTASLLSARVDGAGTFGIAYGATLLSIRAEQDGSCVKMCSFDPAVLARAIDYAVDHGAQVIGMPMASKHPIPLIEPALRRAVARGVVVVAAAGNDGSDQPHWPARYAADPRYAGSILVAGASTRRGMLARWSNKAGVARDHYLAAPGDQIIVDCTTRQCLITSGTSYSVSYVAGALALLISRDPALSGPEAAETLLRSAHDLGGRGTDAVAGRGLLDIHRAMKVAAEARTPDPRGSS